MDYNQLRRFMAIQKHKIEVEKWEEGERVHNDPGPEYVLYWIFKNGKVFREQYERSKCRHCVFWQKCGHRVLESCHICQNESK